MFDPSAPHIIILLVVVLLLFGSTRLPGAAQALGKSMHIFKKSVKGLDDEDKDGAKVQATIVQPAQQPAQPQLGNGADPVQQAQLDDLQRQIAELKRQSANGASGAAPASTAESAGDTQSS